ncbi:MAG: hypothetical protein L0J69_01165 [Yaniella sp.]|nr:hypothetical protein [Yaniella sp.]
MATLIAHSNEASTAAFAQHLANTLGEQRGVTTAVTSLARASRYVDTVEAVVVVAPAEDAAFHREARVFMAAHHAELANKSLFIAGLGTRPQPTKYQLQAMDAFGPRDTAYFRTDALVESAVSSWVNTINTRCAA